MTRSRQIFVLVPVFVGLASATCVCSRTNESSSGDPITEMSRNFTLDRDVASVDLKEMTRAPHPLGSTRQAELITWFVERARAEGATPYREEFTATVPNPAASSDTGAAALTLSLPGVNTWAAAGVASAPECVVLMGSHYDTKIIPGIDYVGANDSGSSSIALLQILRALRAESKKLPKLACDIVMVWFDGEEAYLLEWSDGETKHPAQIQDNTHGSRHAVARFTACTFAEKKSLCLPADLPGIGGKPVAALVLMDMIGSPGIQLARDSFSSTHLLELALRGAEITGNSGIFEKTAKPIEDDHIPFRRAGIAAINLIDFHNLDVWHRPGDEVNQIDFGSIEKASRIGLYVALTIAANPQVFVTPAEKP